MANHDPYGTPIILRYVAAGASSDEAFASTVAINAGFDGIELALRHDGSATDRHTCPDEKSQAVRSPVRTTPSNQSASATVGAISAVCTTTDPEQAGSAVGDLLDRAQALGARCLNLRLPPLAGFDTQAGFASYQDALNFTHFLLRTVRLLAESSGVRLAIEAARGGFLLSPVEMRELIDAADSPALGVCLDVRCVAALGSPTDWAVTLGCRVHSVRTTTGSFTGSGYVQQDGAAGPALADIAHALRHNSFSGVWTCRDDPSEKIAVSQTREELIRPLRVALGIGKE